MTAGAWHYFSLRSIEHADGTLAPKEPVQIDRSGLPRFRWGLSALRPRRRFPSKPARSQRRPALWDAKPSLRLLILRSAGGGCRTAPRSVGGWLALEQFHDSQRFEPGPGILLSKNGRCPERSMRCKAAHNPTDRAGIRSRHIGLTLSEVTRDDCIYHDTKGRPGRCA